MSNTFQCAGMAMDSEGKHSKFNEKNLLLFRIHRFQSCEPQMFRVGDIVQVQLSFVVIPVKAGRRRMLTVLRSLALLDAAFTISSVSLLKMNLC
jgi:hypothetical protein